jgi:hypothetical protein
MRRLLLTLAAVGFAPPLTAAEPKLTDAEYRSVLAAVRPAPGEDAFDLIPWQTSLWEARQRAAREGKPILLWEMDGHPLGCG